MKKHVMGKIENNFERAQRIFDNISYLGISERENLKPDQELEISRQIIEIAKIITNARR